MSGRGGRALRLALVALAAAGTACAHHPEGAHGGRSVRGVEADSVTSGLWRMDESVGTRVADAGPFRLDGIAGVDTRTDFGRVGRARTFTASVNSFVLVPHSSVLEAGGAFTIEAWIDPGALGSYEDTPIAARWTPEALQTSWMLSLVGHNSPPPTQPGPGDHLGLIQFGSAGKLMFAFAPVEAGPLRAFFSNQTIDLDRWTHVAVTYDGQVVRFYLNGELDAQYASPGAVRTSDAPLIIGNYLDPRWLSAFSGDLKVDPSVDQNPYYAFVGLIDDLRISSVARRDFPYARL